MNKQRRKNKLAARKRRRHNNWVSDRPVTGRQIGW